VDGQDPVGLQMVQVGLQTLARQQVDRNRIAAESVDRQDIEFLRLVVLPFPLQRNSGIASTTSMRAGLSLRKVK